MIADNIEAWYHFIPFTDTVSLSHCWQGRMLLHPSVKDKLTHWKNLVDIHQQYTTEEAHNLILTENLWLPSTGHKQNQSFIDHFCLPSHFLAGFPKCGTTTLYNFITAHPDLAKGRHKEGNFWRDLMITKEIVYKKLEVLHYLFHFQPTANAIAADGLGRFADVVVDASPTTVFANPPSANSDVHDVCMLPTVMRQVLPSAKFIVIMRNPVEQLWSDYWYFCSKYSWKIGSQKYSIPTEYLDHGPEIFHKLVLNEIEHFHACMSNSKSPHVAFMCAHRANNVNAKYTSCNKVRLGVSLYYYHIAKWLDIFPRNQFLFLRLEDLESDVHSLVTQVWTFMGLRTDFDIMSLKAMIANASIYGKRNSNQWIKSERYRKRFIMLQETRKLLSNFYKPHISKLATLMNDTAFLWDL